MSTAFTNFLLATSDPHTFMRFRADREAVLKEHALSEEEKESIRAGTASQMRKYAVSVEDAEQNAQFTAKRTLQFNPALIEIEPVVEIHITVDQTTVEIPNQLSQLYKGTDGQIFIGRLKNR